MAEPNFTSGVQIFPMRIEEFTVFSHWTIVTDKMNENNWDGWGGAFAGRILLLWKLCLKTVHALQRRHVMGFCKASISLPQKCHLRKIIIIRTIACALDFQDWVQKWSSTSAGGQYFPCCCSVSPSFSGITEACGLLWIALSSANTVLKPCLRETVTRLSSAEVWIWYIFYM